MFLFDKEKIVFILSNLQTNLFRVDLPKMNPHMQLRSFHNRIQTRLLIKISIPIQWNLLASHCREASTV